MAFLLGAAAPLGQQPSTPAKTPAAVQPALRISLERKLPDGKVETMAFDHVFDSGDVVHFRLESEFDGYLYVMDEGSSGRFTTVFPTSEAGADNRVHKGQTFSIPARRRKLVSDQRAAGLRCTLFSALAGCSERAGSVQLCGARPGKFLEAALQRCGVPCQGRVYRQLCRSGGTAPRRGLARGVGADRGDGVARHYHRAAEGRCHRGFEGKRTRPGNLYVSHGAPMRR